MKLAFVRCLFLPAVFFLWMAGTALVIQAAEQIEPGAVERRAPAEERTAVDLRAPQLWNLMGLIALFGSFGGILASLNECSLKEIREKGIAAFGNAYRMVACLFVGALWGIGGAISFGMIAALDGKFDQVSEPKRILFACMSVAAGFTGLQVLILVSRRLAKEVEEAVDKKTSSVKEELKQEAKREIYLTRDLAAAIASAEGALNKPDNDPFATPHRKDALQQLLSLKQKFPQDRTVGIYVGRLYRRVGELESAIAELSSTLETRRNLRITPNHDDAALLYNRSCYKNLVADRLQKTNHPQAEELKSDSWKDLADSCHLDRGNKDEAAHDPDLQTLFAPRVREAESLNKP